MKTQSLPELTKHMGIKWVHNTIPKAESNLKISKNSDKDNNGESESEKE